jgi:hypothetical protein
MIALYDFLPRFCPNCGKQQFDPGRLDQRRLMRQDFIIAKCSFSCDCGLGYQCANTELLREAATNAGGDLAQYH